MKHLITLASAYEIELTEEQIDKFQLYSDYLLEYNEKVNLTAIKTEEDVVTKHFLDSLLALAAYEVPQNAKLIDVGTGAGFPGVPLKIARPDIQLTLLDSLQKRLTFLELLGEKLAINYELIHSRAEHLSLELGYRDSYDVVTSRAVANLTTLCEYCLPYVEVGGVFLALKGPEVEEEIANAEHAMEILGGEVVGLQEYTLPDGDGRTIIIIEKIEPTPKDYPRQGIKIGKTPL